MRHRLGIAALALLGIALAAAITFAASTLTSQRIGISGESLTAGDRLARPETTPAPTATPRPRRRPRPRPTAFATPAPTIDDEAGDEDGGGKGRGRNRGRGGGDDD